MYFRPSMSLGISPGDDDKSRAISLRGEAACTLSRQCRPASRPATRRSPARSPCGARRPAPLAVDVARHLARRQEEVPRDLIAGQGGMHSRPSMSPDISPGDNRKPCAIPRGARRPALSAVDVAGHLAWRRRQVPRDLLAGRGGLYSWPPMSPGISPGDNKKSCATSLRGEAACIRGR